MPEILQLDTPDWMLVVWTKDTDTAIRRLQRTLQHRDKPLPPTRLSFSPALLVTDEDCVLSEYQVAATPLFFENKLYEFEFRFRHGRYEAGSPAVLHRLQAVEEAFHYAAHTDSLRGSLNFANDVGWFRLKLTYTRAAKRIEQSIAFEVLPLKMDLHTDLVQIQQVIDRQYPLWRFALSHKTDTELERSRQPHERFPLLWLAQFAGLREALQAGVRQILNAPHSRLLSKTDYCRAEPLQGRLTRRQEEAITTDQQQGLTQRRYRQQQRHLSADTPENRFVKRVLQHCVRELSRFAQRAATENAAPENSRLSASFFQALQDWQTPLQQQLNQPFFRDIGAFSGLNGTSLVLHQKAGYAAVYRVWLQLRMYLEVLGRHAAVSVKSVAELYEVWCFLEIRRVLTETLGFSEQMSTKAQLDRKRLERHLHDGIGSAFVLERADGVRLRLAHEPVIGRLTKGLRQGLVSWTTTQKPDILLDITLPDGQRLCWIFDAKYRIQEGAAGQDTAPDDAINQMHRYRDALIYADSRDAMQHTKSRPVFGAFVLFPGWFEQHGQINPAQAAIDAVGIGSFPLLPGQPCLWLQQFLEQQLGKITPQQTAAYPQADADRYFVQDAGRISYSGMHTVRYRDLTLVAGLGGGRSADYVTAFREGTAQWYHLPVTTPQQRRVAHFVMQELRYCALAVPVVGTPEREIGFVYPVLAVECVKRSAITEAQSGSRKIRDPDAVYWLFTLGAPLRLGIRVLVPGMRDFKFRLTGLDDLSTAGNWQALPDRYVFLAHDPQPV